MAAVVLHPESTALFAHPERNAVADAPVCEIAKRVNAAANFPFLALAAIQAGLRKEGLDAARLRVLSNETREIQQQIRQLLDLSAEIVKTPDGNLSPQAKQILEQLKAGGVDLLKGKTSLTKETILELKSLVNSHTDKCRNDIQINLSTKIQPLIQMMSTINDCLRMIEKYNSRLGQTLTGNQRSR